MTKRTERKILLALLTLTVVGVVVWGSHWVMTPSPEKVAKKAAELKAKEFAKTHPPPPARTTQGSTEALVLQNECLTPCSTNIAWKFKIRTDGHPLRIKFQGVRDWVTYQSEGDFQAPQMQSGETQFISSDEKNPHVRVQVYRRITVPGGR